MQFSTQKSIFENMRQFLKSISTTVSDFTSGSTLNTIFYAISQSVGNLNETIRNVYNSIFISTATGTDLDLKVADFGLERKQSTLSTGIATFSRSSAAITDYAIITGTKIKTLSTADVPGIEFETTEDKILSKTVTDSILYIEETSAQVSLSSRFVNTASLKVTGDTLSGDLTLLNYVFSNVSDYTITESNTDKTRQYLSWKNNALNKPEVSTYYSVEYFPLSVDVKIQSRSTGISNNVPIGVITDFIDVVPGIEKVTNYDRTSGGTDTETDTLLRSRVPLYLSSLSKATKNAIIASALSVPGITNVSVSESTFPDGIIRVFVDDGTGGASSAVLQLVRDAIDGTIGGVESTDAESVRAAGLGVNVESPSILEIYFNFQVTYDPTLGLSNGYIASDIKTKLINYLQGLSTGAIVYRSKAIDVIMGVTGVLDMNTSGLMINSKTDDKIYTEVNQVPRTYSNNITITS